MRFHFSAAGLVAIAAWVSTSCGRDAPHPPVAGSAWYAGQPAPLSEICASWIAQSEFEHQLIQPGARGQFTAPWQSDNAGGRRLHQLFARDPHGRLGWYDVRSEWYAGIESELRIELIDVGDTQGRITNAVGTPVRQARVQATGFTSNGEPQTYCRVPEPLRKYWTAMTDDDGRFTLRSVPRDGSVRAELAAPGYGQLTLNWRRKSACEVRLQKPGSIRVRFEGAADPAKLRGLKVHLYGRSATTGRAEVELSSSIEDVMVGETMLRVADVMPGKYVARVDRDTRSPCVAENPHDFEVPPGGVAEIVVPVSPAAELRGRVVDARTRQGIAYAKVIVNHPGPQGRSLLSSTETDAEGRYVAYVSPGDRGVSVPALTIWKPSPRGYRPPSDRAKPPTAIVMAGDSHTFPDLELEPMLSVEGVVLDAAGKPLPGIPIYTAHSFAPDFRVFSDAAGRFLLTDLGPDEETALRARTATATTDGAVPFTVRERNEPIKLVLSDANAFRIRGRAADSGGQPISGAKVRIVWHYWGVGRAHRSGIGASSGFVYSEPDGHFTSRALVPGDEYQLLIEAAGFGNAQTNRVRGVAGQTHDFGAVTLPRINARIAGIVLDSRNRPVEGVRVLNSGDGPKPVSTTTGADGRFELAGLFDGPAWLCAHKAGYRWASLRCKSGDRDAAIVLQSADEPKPESRADSDAAAHADNRKKLTRHLLDSLWALPDETLAGFRRSVLEGMARFDLAQAHRWFDERSRRGAGDTGADSALARVLAVADAETIAETDADEAIGLLAPLSPGDAQRTLLAIGKRLQSSDRRRALRIAEEAALKSRAMPLPNRAWAMAEVGELLAQLGERDSGRKLVFEAADLAEQLGAQRLHAFGRGMVAVSLAPFDFNRARNLISLQSENERERWLAAIAVRIAPDNLDRALELIRPIPLDSSLKPDTEGRIARRLAEAGKTAEAIQLAKSIDNRFTPLAAIVSVAEIVSRSDRIQARTLIDDALNRYWNEPERLLPFNRFYRPIYMAQIGCCAKLARHPDLDDVVARIMACRPAAPHDGSPNDVADKTAQMAMVLSFLDPSTAQWLMRRATAMRSPPQDGRLENQRTWLFAVALADPQNGIGEIDRAIAAAKASAKGVTGTGLMELVTILSQPTENERRRQMIRYAGLYWPSNED